MGTHAEGAPTLTGMVPLQSSVVNPEGPRLEGRRPETSRELARSWYIGRDDKLENFDLIFSPLLKRGRGY